MSNSTRESIQRLRSACWKNCATTGSALRAPWPHAPIVIVSLKPTRAPATSCGCIMRNQPSVFSCVVLTLSPTLIWAKFFTAGPAWTSIIWPSASFNVIQRSLASIFVTVAVYVSLADTVPPGRSWPTANEGATAVVANATMELTDRMIKNLVFMANSFP
jgi:hypothetical protein